MKNITPGMKIHLAGEETSLTTIWRLTRTDGFVLGLTDLDSDLFVDGVLYKSGSGYTPSANDTSSEGNVDQMEMELTLDSSTITDDDLAAGKWDYAKVECLLVNYRNPADGVIWMRSGHLGEVKTGRVKATAELRGLLQNIQQKIGRFYAPTCGWNLGDSRCKVDLAPRTSMGTVTGVISEARFDTDVGGHPDNDFKGGRITWLSGANVGLKKEVKSSTAGGELYLQEPMPFTVEEGDTFSVYVGCDKTTGAGGCAKFNNIANHGGFPLNPGNDQYVSGKK